MGKTAPKRRSMKVTETEVDVDDDAISWDEAPLFAMSDQKLRSIDHVSVIRKDPDSGYLGRMTSDVSEATLAAKWGGGTYRLEAKNALGQVLKGGVHVAKLAGNPVFSSEVEEMQWRKSNGLAERKAADPALSARDLLLVIEEKDEKRRKEQLEREDRLRADMAAREERERAELAARDERERKAREEREAQKQRDADERRAREQKDADEREDRRARTAREDDERRARIHREDMERMASQNAQQLANSQQFFTQLTTSLKTDQKAAPSFDPVKTLLSGMQIAREMLPTGGGGDGEAPPKNFLTALMARLPETLQEVRRTAAGVKAELAGGAGPDAGPDAGDTVKIKGPLATKVKRVIAQLQSAGKNPAAELTKLLAFMEEAPPAPAPATSVRSVPAMAAAPRIGRTKQASSRPKPVRTKQARPRAAPARARKTRPTRRGRAA